jgi:hypothetical protein
MAAAECRGVGYGAYPTSKLYLSCPALSITAVARFLSTRQYWETCRVRPDAYFCGFQTYLPFMLM